MKLLYQTHSPFARKALVFAHEVGLSARIEVVHHETSPTRRNVHVFCREPARQSSSSRSTWAAVDFRLRRHLRPSRHSARRTQVGPARGRGSMASAVHAGRGSGTGRCRYRGSLGDGPPAGRTAVRTAAGRNVEKLIASYDWLERELEVAPPLHVGHIALATALSWLEFRELPTFREKRPRLVAWFDEFEARPSMRVTPLSGQTQD